MAKLSTTSFALLGLLGRQAWSAYELTKFMRHSILRAIWPRAESHIYSECKNLERSGLVDATQKATGKRKRTEYAINATGREALQEWLARPAGSRFQIESESLTQLVNADRRDQVLAILAHFRQEAAQDASWTLEEISRFFDESFGIPEGRDYNAMVTALLADMMVCRLRWAERMEQLLAAGAEGEAERNQRALAIYQEIDEQLRAIAR